MIVYNRKPTLNLKKNNNVDFKNFTFEVSQQGIVFENFPKNIFEDNDGDPLTYYFKSYEKGDISGTENI